jgi:hypothetical protein
VANSRTLTTANSVLLLSVDTIFPVAVQITGFSADDITNSDAVTSKEMSMGIDGRLSAGFVPVAIPQNIVLQSDSLSVDFFEQWISYEASTAETYFATGTLLIPSLEKSYTMNRGVLMSHAAMPSLRKTAQPRTFMINWESVIPAPNF